MSEGIIQVSIDFRDARVKYGIGGVAAVLLIGLLFFHRSGTEAGTTAGKKFTASFISGDGKRQTSAGADFLSMVIPTEIGEKDLLMFSDSADNNVLSLPEKATLRFAAGSSATIDRLEQVGKRYEVTVEMLGGRVWVNAPQSYDVTIIAKAARVASNPGAVFDVTLSKDENYYDVATVRVFTGSVTLGGRTEKSDNEVVNEWETARVNEDKLFKPEAFQQSSEDRWEAWNLEWSDPSEMARASSGGSQSAPTRSAPSGANPPLQRPGGNPHGPQPPHLPFPSQAAQGGPGFHPNPPGPRPENHPPPLPQTQPPPLVQPPGQNPPPVQPRQQPPQQPVRPPTPPSPTLNAPVYAPNATPLASPDNGGGNNPPPPGGGSNGNPPPGGNGQPNNYAPPYGGPGATGLPATVMPNKAPPGY